VGDLVRAAAHAGISIPPAPSSVHEDSAAVAQVLVAWYRPSWPLTRVCVSRPQKRQESDSDRLRRRHPGADRGMLRRQPMYGASAAAVDVQVPAGDGCVDHVFRLSESDVWTLVELVCHESPGDAAAAPASLRSQSTGVGAHVTRTVRYLNAHNEVLLRAHEEAHRG
jgi:hypothetical protein